MNETAKRTAIGVPLLALYFVLFFVFGPAFQEPVDAAIVHKLNTPEAPELQYSVLRTGPLRVARVFARSGRCLNAPDELIQLIADEAWRAGLDPELAAALVGVESNCEPLAISPRGAVGLTQIRVGTWSEIYDFDETNPFNSTTNLRIGFSVFSDLVKTWGPREACRRYQGLGAGGDDGYADKILKLSDIKER